MGPTHTTDQRGVQSFKSFPREGRLPSPHLFARAGSPATEGSSCSGGGADDRVSVASYHAKKLDKKVPTGLLLRVLAPPPPPPPSLLLLLLLLAIVLLPVLVLLLVLFLGGGAGGRTKVERRAVVEHVPADRNMP